MIDLGPLLAAVTDEWERGKTIAERAGIDSRTAGPRLAVLERQGFVASSWDRKARLTIYRRGPNAPPVDAASAPEYVLRDLLRDLRGRLEEMALNDDGGDAAYMAACHEITAWLDDHEASSWANTDGDDAAQSHPSPDAYRQATRAREWEVVARGQAARADHLEEVLRTVFESVAFVESVEMDDLDDRMRCEQDGCQARGWIADGFVGTRELAWCPRHAPGEAPETSQRGGA